MSCPTSRQVRAPPHIEMRLTRQLSQNVLPQMVVGEPVTTFLFAGDYVTHLELLMDVPFLTPYDTTRARTTEILFEGALGYAAPHPKFPRLPFLGMWSATILTTILPIFEFQCWH